MFELTIDELLALGHDELAKIALKFQDEIRVAHLKLGLARVTIAEIQASLKRKSRALRNIESQRRSLRQTVKRRRKSWQR